MTAPETRTYANGKPTRTPKVGEAMKCWDDDDGAYVPGRITSIIADGLVEVCCENGVDFLYDLADLYVGEGPSWYAHSDAKDTSDEEGW